MLDIILHSVAALIMVAIAVYVPLGLSIAVGIGWLLRELAQSNSGDVIQAVKSMPTWSRWKHAEWVAPFVVALLAEIAAMVLL